MGTPAKGAFFGQTNYFAAETPRSRMAMAIRMVALDSKSSRRYRRNVGNPEQAAGLVGDLALATLRSTAVGICRCAAARRPRAVELTQVCDSFTAAGLRGVRPLS